MPLLFLKAIAMCYYSIATQINTNSGKMTWYYSGKRAPDKSRPACTHETFRDHEIFTNWLTESEVKNGFPEISLN